MHDWAIKQCLLKMSDRSHESDLDKVENGKKVII